MRPNLGSTSIDKLFAQGQAYQAKGVADMALNCYLQVMQAAPGHGPAFFQSGVIACQQGHFEVAADLLSAAADISPDAPEVHYQLGVVFQHLRQFDKALQCYDRTLALRPDFGDAHENRGTILSALRKFEEALKSYDSALVAKGQSAQLLSNRAVALRELRQLDAALACCDEAIERDARDVEAHLNCGNVLRDLQRLDEAWERYQHAIALDPDCVEAYVNRGLLLAQRRRFDEALTSYRHATRLNPASAEAHWNQALLYLLRGQFAEGWAQYEWRWKNDSLGLSRQQRNFSQPLWLGKESLEGKTILLHAEQGLGDTLQFARYAEEVVARGAKVILEVPPPLRDLMATLQGPDQVIGRGEPLPAFDYHCPLMSLPLACGTRLQTIPARVPYLKADPERMAALDARLPAKTKPRIGLVWQGNKSHVNDANRSMRLAALAPLISERYQFVSLQKEIHEEDQAALADLPDLILLGDALDDFADTAAACALMDLVITVDTSVAHLAGALARPLWVLLPHYPEWRWLLEREDSPWYPTAKLYRQSRAADWSSVIQRVGADLARRLA